MYFSALKVALVVGTILLLINQYDFFYCRDPLASCDIDLLRTFCGIPTGAEECKNET